MSLECSDFFFLCVNSRPSEAVNPLREELFSNVVDLLNRKIQIQIQSMLEDVAINKDNTSRFVVIVGNIFNISPHSSSLLPSKACDLLLDILGDEIASQNLYLSHGLKLNGQIRSIYTLVEFVNVSNWEPNDDRLNSLMIDDGILRRITQKSNSRYSRTTVIGRKRRKYEINVNRNLSLNDSPPSVELFVNEEDDQELMVDVANWRQVNVSKVKSLIQKLQRRINDMKSELAQDKENLEYLNQELNDYVDQIEELQVR